MSSTSTLIIPDSLKNEDPAILAAAMKLVEGQLAKQKEAELKKAVKALSVANGIKAERLLTTTTKGKNRKINDSYVFEYAKKNDNKHVYICKGEQSERLWLTLELDTNSNQYITGEGTKYRSLSDAHNDFVLVKSGKKNTVKHTFWIENYDNKYRLDNTLGGIDKIVSYE